MRSEDLAGWLKEKNWKKDPEGRRWVLVVWLVQLMFSFGTVLVEIEWDKMVLIPKGKGGYRGIGMVKVLCKVCLVVVNFPLKRSVMLNNTLHGFREGRGKGTATLEAKLDQ